MLREDATLLAIAQDFATDNDVFLKEFAAAWTKVMNADRFSGPASNVCDTVDPVVPSPTPSAPSTNDNTVMVVLLSILGTVLVMGAGMYVYTSMSTKAKQQEPLLGGKY